MSKVTENTVSEEKEGESVSPVKGEQGNASKKNRRGASSYGREEENEEFKKSV